MDLVRFEPMQPGWGSTFQSGWVDDMGRFLSTVPQPFGTVSLAYDGHYPQSATADLIDTATFLYRHLLHDDERGLLTDVALSRIVDLIAGHLSDGVNVHIHCIADQSRSSYIHAAVWMRARGWTAQEAIDYIASRKSGVREHMQGCFREHLARWKP